MKTILIASVVLAMASCYPLPKESLSGIEYGCASATATLRTITLLNDKLTASNRANVSRAVAIIDPVCSQGGVPTLTSTARATFDGALTLLTSASVQVTQ